jgi:hypothetical protein
LRSESFVSPFTDGEVFRIEGANTTTGGLPLTALKNEYGARFGRPPELIVEIQPIGRGATDPSNS